jgi:hypothetical protein
VCLWPLRRSKSSNGPRQLETRSFLYWLARFLGDYQAVKSIYVGLGFEGAALGG